MCVCMLVWVRVLYVHDVLEFLALGPVGGIAEGVHLIQFRCGPAEDGGGVCVLLICVCCESLIKYFACKDSEHSLNGASESSGSPSPVSEAGS